MALVLLSVIGWLISALAGLWLFNTFREMRNEIRLIRRYLQLLTEQTERSVTIHKQ